MSIMNTFTGKQFDPMKIKAEDICIEDIAHALSLLCRGGGHLIHFYSVAQHSINCANEAKARGYSDKVVLSCLLHDATECYISDVIRPVKQHLSNYNEIEKMIMDVIWKKYGLDALKEEEKLVWRQIDNDILGHELKNMMVGERDRSVVKLEANLDFSERNYREVENEFYKMAEGLLNEK